MGFANDLVNAGYTGYRGWGDAEARADFNATHGSGKGGPSGGGSSGGGSSFTPMSASDLAGARKQIAGVLQKYYTQIAQEAEGDFTKAVAILKSDYQRGIRTRIEQQALDVSQSKDELSNTLGQMGLQNLLEQQKQQSNLGDRGILAVQNDKNGQVLTPQVSTPTDNPDFANFNASSNVANMANPALQGQAGTEMANLQRQQQLKNEAAQRAKMLPLQQSGLALKQYTQTSNGFDPNNPLKSVGITGNNPADLKNVNLDGAGQAELQLLQGVSSQAKDLRTTQEGLSQQMGNEVNNVASGFAQLGSGAKVEDLTNQLQQEKQQNFVTQGVT